MCMSVKKIWNPIFVQPIGFSDTLTNEQSLVILKQAMRQSDTSKVAILLLNQQLKIIQCADQLLWCLQMAQELELLHQLDRRLLTQVINNTNQQGDTALLLALRYEYFSIAIWLISQNIDINKSNICGETALILASWHNRSDIVKLLLKQQSDVNSTDSTGKTALDYAIKNHNKQIMQLLG